MPGLRALQRIGMVGQVEILRCFRVPGQRERRDLYFLFPEEQMIIVYKDTTQFVLWPSAGIVRDAGHLCLTIAFMYYGISFRLLRLPKAGPEENINN